MDTIQSKKLELRRTYQAYKDAVAPYDCGSHLAAVMSAEVAQCARTVNVLVVWLKEHDPEFPQFWIPLPTGS